MVQLALFGIHPELIPESSGFSKGLCCGCDRRSGEEFP
jgi:hypothetical protein